MSTQELREKAVAYRINSQDNVATLLAAAEPGEAPLIGEGADRVVVLQEPVERGHKVALTDIPCGSPVTKYAHAIGLASRDIQAGEWVHLHNCRSFIDERSATLDRDTGAPTDVSYE